MSTAYVVSDIHIVSPGCPRAGRFLQFLRQLSGARASHLVLLGDIFDLWIADHRYFVERYRDIVAELTRLRDEGVHIIYFEGNHDLHLQRFWAGELGFEVHGGPVHLELGGLRVRLEHGDQMDPEDRGYRFLRWFLRTPPMRFVLHRLPGTAVAWTGERASRHSRTYTSQHKTISRPGAVEKIRAHAERAHAERPFDLIVSGHVHVRDDHRVERPGASYRSVNLGSWLDAPCYLRIDASGARLAELA